MTRVGIGTNLTAKLVSGPANGSLNLKPDGSFTYTPTHELHRNGQLQLSSQ